MKKRNIFFNLLIVCLLFVVISLNAQINCPIRGLTDDIADNNFGAAINTFTDTSDGKKAWLFMFDAYGQSRAFTKDIPTLNKIKNLLNDNVFKTNLGGNWAEELSVIIEKNRILACNACGTASGFAAWFRTMPEFLDDFKYFVKNFDTSQGGANTFYRWAKRTNINDNAAVIHEMYQTLYTLKKRGLTSNDITQFGAVIGDGVRKSDLLTITGKHIELKNVDFVTTKLKNNSHVTNQFIEGPLLHIDNLDNYEIVISYKKLHAKGNGLTEWSTLDNATTAMKNQFKEMLITKADDLFKPINDGGIIGVDRMKQIFNDQSINNPTIFINKLNNNDTFRENALRYITVE